MTLAAIIIAALSLALSAVAIWLAVLARSEAITCRRELSRHRAAHAQAAEEGRPTEERRTSRHRPPPELVTGPPTAQITAQAPATNLIETPEPPRGSRLPRPGRIQ